MLPNILKTIANKYEAHTMEAKDSYFIYELVTH